MDTTDDARRKRLLYRAQHRGFKEADLLIGGFAAAFLAAMTESELAEFETLLQFPDPDLYAWLKGGETPPPDISAGSVFQRLAAFEPGRLSRR
jgi:antitoxin CptB